MALLKDGISEMIDGNVSLQKNQNCLHQQEIWKS